MVLPPYTPALLLSNSNSREMLILAGADLGILRGGGGVLGRKFFAGGGGGVRVQVHGNFHILTSKKQHKKTFEGGLNPLPPPPGSCLGYFRQGYTNDEILATLLTRHGTVLSLSHLKRILRDLGLRRRSDPRQHLPLYDIIDAIISVTEHSGKCLGYRTVWKRIKMNMDWWFQGIMLWN